MVIRGEETISDTFPFPRDDFELHITAADCWLFHVIREKGLPKSYLGMRDYQQWRIPRLAAEYLIRSDGQTRYEDICSAIRVPFKLLADRVAGFLASETGVITFRDQPSDSRHNLFVTGRFDGFAPLTKEINCGAGWRTFGLNGATGEVRSCLFLADSKKFGSVDKENYVDIFKNKEMKMFRDAPSPSAGLKTCRSCKHIAQCNGCFAKAFRVSQTENPECLWRQQYFPGIEFSVYRRNSF